MHGHVLFASSLYVSLYFSQVRNKIVRGFNLLLFGIGKKANPLDSHPSRGGGGEGDGEGGGGGGGGGEAKEAIKRTASEVDISRGGQNVNLWKEHCDSVMEDNYQPELVRCPRLLILWILLP